MKRWEQLKKNHPDDFREISKGWCKKHREKFKDKIREYNLTRRKKTKSYIAKKWENSNIKKLKELFGNKCYLCGYCKHPKILQFHHKDGENKEFSLSEKKGCNIEVLKKEAEKCMLLCPNCHAEIHFLNK